LWGLFVYFPRGLNIYAKNIQNLGKPSKKDKKANGLLLPLLLKKALMGGLQFPSLIKMKKS